jgi:hypothetical protein
MFWTCVLLFSRYLLLCQCICYYAMKPANPFILNAYELSPVMTAGSFIPTSLAYVEAARRTQTRGSFPR